MFYHKDMRILIIEDVKKLALYIKRGLEAKGFNVDCVYDGEAGEMKAFDEEYDLIILDLMLPKKNGISICKAMREENVPTPVLMLTAKKDVEDKVNGLNCGADDYLTKPFDFKELLARTQALLRRPKEKLPDTLKVGILALTIVQWLLKGVKADKAKFERVCCFGIFDAQ